MKNPVRDGRIFPSLIGDVINHPALDLSYVRRLALLESISSGSSTTTATDCNSSRSVVDNLAQVVTEGILTCPRLSANAKNCIVTHGLLERRWDSVLTFYRLKGGYDDSSSHVQFF